MGKVEGNMGRGALACAAQGLSRACEGRAWV